MRVLTQFENNAVVGGCDVCGGKQAIDPKTLVGATVGGLALATGVAYAGFGAGYIGASLVLGAVAGSFTTGWLVTL